MSDKAASWIYCDEVVEENEIFQQARLDAQEIGCFCPSPASGKLLSVLAHMLSAKSAVIVGTGGGITGLYLMAGMDESGTITNIDTDPEHIQVTRMAFTASKIRTSRTRFITGASAQALSKISDESYDMVVLSKDFDNFTEILTQGIRLVKSAGALVVLNALYKDEVADPTKRNVQATNLRSAISEIVNRDDLYSTILPVGEGVLLVTKR